MAVADYLLVGTRDSRRGKGADKLSNGQILDRSSHSGVDCPARRSCYVGNWLACRPVHLFPDGAGSPFSVHRRRGTWLRTINDAGSQLTANSLPTRTQATSRSSNSWERRERKGGCESSFVAGLCDIRIFRGFLKWKTLGSGMVTTFGPVAHSCLHCSLFKPSSSWLEGANTITKVLLRTFFFH